MEVIIDRVSTPASTVTAAIDAATEVRIRHALRETAAGSATIIVSHRLGALRHADEILFLEDGRVVERGGHDALVAAGGRYAALFALQTLDGSEAPSKEAAE